MKPRKKQREIYTAALELFATKGFEKTTMDGIALKLSMTKGNLYLYAKNKKDLYEQAIRFALKRWQRKVALDIDGIESPVDQFKILCNSSFNYLKKDVSLCKIIINDPSIFPINRGDDRFADLNNKAAKLLETIIEKGINQGVFRKVPILETVRYLYSIYIMFIIQTYIHGDESNSSALFDIAVDVNLNGLLI